MFYTPRILRLALFVAVAREGFHYPVARAAELTSGSLIALRVGSGSALSTRSAAIFIDELAAGTGAVIQTIAIPSSSTNSCTLAGVGVGEGLLTTSFDGQVTSFACYMAASGTANVVTTLAGNRAIINILPSGAASTRVGLGSMAYQYRAVYGAVVMDTAGNWYSTGPSGGTARGISFNSPAGSFQTPILGINTRKLIVLPSGTSDRTAFFISSSSTGPGLGIAILGTAGSPPTTQAAGTRITTSTATDAFYGTTASPASFVFFNATWLWVCDDGAVASKGGVWLFVSLAATGLFQPTSSSSRVWSGGQCSDIALNDETGVPVLYWVGGTTAAGNGIYRMPVSPSGLSSGFTATLLLSAAANNVYRGISLSPVAPTPSQSQSQSQPQTATRTPSQTQTLSRTSSVTETGTQVQTVSCSVTSTLDSTPSQSQSVSQSQSPQPSTTASPSGTASRLLDFTSSPSASQFASTTSSPSVSGFVSLTCSGSQTECPSWLSTLSGSVSPSTSASASSSPSPSGSPSLSVSPSTIASPSTSGTSSSSPSPSGSPSLSVSPSTIAFPSTSGTSSSTVTASLISSSSVSESPSSSGSGSKTGSPSLSSTWSARGSSSPSRTGSPTFLPSSRSSGHETLARSNSMSDTMTSAAFHSASPSNSFTGSNPSALPSLSGASGAPAVDAGSMTTSRSGANSPSASPAQAATVTQTPLLLLLGESRSETPTPSPTPTPVPYALNIRSLRGGGGVNTDGAIPLSDSLPPAQLTPVLNRCPTDPGQLTVTLACGMTFSDTSPPPSLLIAVLPSATMTLGCSVSDTVAAIPLSVSVHILPPFGTPSFAAVVSCTLTGADGSAMGLAAIDVSVTATRWPTFDDVVILSSNGFSRSVGGVGPGKVNSTEALLDVWGAMAQQSRALQAQALDAAALAASLASPPVVLTAMRRAWGGIAVPPDSARPFALTIFGSTPVVLRSRRRSFWNKTVVRMGAVICNDTVISDDGEWLATTSPSPSSLCGTAGGGCAYTSIVVENPSDTADERGAALTCPPFCSQAISGGVVPLSVLTSQSTATFVPAMLDVISSALVPVDLTLPDTSGSLAVSAIAASSGLFYSEACSDSGIYTDPSSGACTNASDPAFALCAFGSGAECRSCPGGALCPGGYRAWPRPGHWSAAESSPDVRPCVQPDATGKCLGWSAALGAAQCGAQYRQGSFLCAACAPAHYLSGDGTCAPCPVSPSLWTRYSGLFILVSAVAGFALVIYSAILTTALASSLVVRDIVKDMATLIVRLLTILQVLSNVAQASSSRLPAVLRSLYLGIGLFQLQGLTLPPACVNGYPFSSEVSVLGFAVGVWLIALGAASLRPWFPDRLCRPVIIVGMTLAVYLHPSASFSALRLLDCRSVQLSTTAVAALQDSVGVSAASSISSDFSRVATLTTVSILASLPLVPCFGRLHAPAGGFAAAALLCYVFAMPAITLLWLWRDRRTPAHSSSSLYVTRTRGKRRTGDPAPPLEPLLYPFQKGSDYTESSWFWRHIDLAVVFGLSAINALLPTPESLPQVTVKLVCAIILLGILLLMFLLLPNPYKLPWKRSVRVALIVLSTACVAINGASRALDLGLDEPVLALSITPGAYAILALASISFVTLVVGFGYGVLSKARELTRSMVAAYSDVTSFAAAGGVQGVRNTGDLSSGHANSESPCDLRVTALRERHIPDVITSGIGHSLAACAEALTSDDGEDEATIVLAVAPTVIVEDTVLSFLSPISNSFLSPIQTSIATQLDRADGVKPTVVDPVVHLQPSRRLVVSRRWSVNTGQDMQRQNVLMTFTGNETRQAWPTHENTVAHVVSPRASHVAHSQSPEMTRPSLAIEGLGGRRPDFKLKPRTGTRRVIGFPATWEGTVGFAGETAARARRATYAGIPGVLIANQEAPALASAPRKGPGPPRMSPFSVAPVFVQPPLPPER